MMLGGKNDLSSVKTPYRRHSQVARYDDENIIDIVKSSYYPYQNKEYNKLYKKWRSDKKNGYAYRYVNDRRENCYMEGVGYIKVHPEKIERSVLSRTAFIIGIAFMAQFIIEIFGGYFLALFVNLFGGGLTWEILGGFIGGSESYAVAINSVISILSAAVPLFVLYFSLQLPTGVAFPVKIVDKRAFHMAIPFIMVMLPVGLFCQFIYGSFLGAVGISMDMLMLPLPQSKLLLAVTLVTYVIVVPLITEICLRGILLQVLRQYGDGFALLFTSLIAAFLTHDITQFCLVFIISLGVGFFVLRTGSVLTGMIMRIAFRLGTGTLMIIDSFAPEKLAVPIQAWVLCICLIIGSAALFFTGKRVQPPLYTSLGKTSLSVGEKFFTISTSPTMGIWVVLIFIMTIGCIKMV